MRSTGNAQQLCILVDNIKSHSIIPENQTLVRRAPLGKAVQQWQCQFCWEMPCPGAAALCYPPGLKGTLQGKEIAEGCSKSCRKLSAGEKVNGDGAFYHRQKTFLMTGFLKLLLFLLLLLL